MEVLITRQCPWFVIVLRRESDRLKTSFFLPQRESNPSCEVYRSNTLTPTLRLKLKVYFSRDLRNNTSHSVIDFIPITNILSLPTVSYKAKIINITLQLPTAIQNKLFDVITILNIFIIVYYIKVSNYNSSIN